VKRRDVAWLAGLIAAGLALRVPGLLTGLWRDEGSTYFDATAPTLAATLREIRLAEINPPGYFLLMRAWLALAGTTDLSMKLPSFVFGIAVVPATYALGRRLASSEAGLLAAAFAAFSTLGIDLSSDARPYALGAFLAALSTLAAFRILLAEADEPLAPALIFYGVTATALAYVQYTGLLLACGLALGAVVCRLALPRLARAGTLPTGVRTGTQPTRARVGAFLVANVAVAIAYLPWFPALGGAGRVSASWLQPIAPGQFPARLLEEIGYALPLDFMRTQYAVLLLVAGAIAIALRRANPAIAIGAAASLAAFATETWLLLREPRYVFVFTPLTYVLVAFALVALYRACAARLAGRTKSALGTLAIVLGAFVVLSLFAGIPAQSRAFARTVAHPERSGMRELVAASHAGFDARTLIVVAPDYLGPALGYYLRAFPDATVLGIPHGEHPERFRCCEDAWRRPALVADAEREIMANARGFTRIAFVYDPGATDRGEIPYSRALELRAKLMRDLPVLSEHAYAGSLEPAAVTVFATTRRS
jgi:hypothetical protein